MSDQRLLASKVSTVGATANSIELLVSDQRLLASKVSTAQKEAEALCG